MPYMDEQIINKDLAICSNIDLFDFSGVAVGYITKSYKNLRILRHEEISL